MSKKKLFARRIKRFAFSTSELLIALSIIGVIAIIGGSIAFNSIDANKMEVQKAVLNNELALALADMETNGDLATNSSQEEFLNKFSSYFSITGGDVKDSEGAFPDTDDYFPTSSYKVGSETPSISLDPNEYDIHLETNKGAVVALTYDQNYKSSGNFVTDSSSGKNNTYQAKNQALSAVTGFYDVNGKKGPNKLGVDVGIIYEIDATCAAKSENTNYLCDSSGNQVCTVTSAICKSNNKTFDKTNCECKCTRTCPSGTTLNTSTCICEVPNSTICPNPNVKDCAITAGECASGHCSVCQGSDCYCKIDPDSGKLVLQNLLAPKLCTMNGGVWNSENCSCDCSSKPLKDECGYGQYNPQKFCAYENFRKKVNYNNFPVISAITTKEFGGLLNTYLTNKNIHSSVQEVAKSYVNYPNYANDFTCKAYSGSNLNINKTACYCAASCPNGENSDKAYDHSARIWKGLNESDMANSCKDSCNTTLLNQRVTDLNNTYTTSLPFINKGSSLDVYAWEILKDAYDWCNECGGKDCGACTNCCDVNKNANLSKLVKAYKSGALTTSTQYKFKGYPAENQCYIGFEPTYVVPKNIGLWFHCVKNRCRYYEISFGQKGNFNSCFFKYGDSVLCSGVSSASIDMSKGKFYDYIAGDERFKADSNDSSSPLNKGYWALGIRTFNIAKVTKVYETYDPIVLTSSTSPDDSIEQANTTVSFNLGEGVENDLPWVDFSTGKYSYLMQSSSALSGTNVDIRNMFSDVNDYTTGLAELKARFDANSDGLVKPDEFTNSAGKTLYFWNDKNNNASVDSGEYGKLSNTNVIEINTNVLAQFENGEVVKVSSSNGGFAYGVKGQYKKAVSATLYSENTYYAAPVAQIGTNKTQLYYIFKKGYEGNLSTLKNYLYSSNTNASGYINTISIKDKNENDVDLSFLDDTNAFLAIRTNVVATSGTSKNQYSNSWKKLSYKSDISKTVEIESDTATTSSTTTTESTTSTSTTSSVIDTLVSVGTQIQETIASALSAVTSTNTKTITYGKEYDLSSQYTNNEYVVIHTINGTDYTYEKIYYLSDVVYERDVQ